MSQGKKFAALASVFFTSAKQDNPEAAKQALSPQQRDVYHIYRTMLSVGISPTRVKLLMLLSRIPIEVIHAVMVQPTDTNRKVQSRKHHEMEHELDAMAALMVKREQWDEAYRLYRQILTLKRESHHRMSTISKSKDHVSIHSTYNHLIFVLLNEHVGSDIPNRFEKAMELYQEKLDSDWDSFSSIDYRGSGSWESCQLLNSVLLDGRRNDALLWYQQLAETRETNGDDANLIATIYHRMALLLDRATDSPEIPMALELFEKALQLYLQNPRDNLDKIEVTCSKLLNQRNRQSDGLLGLENDQKILDLYHRLVDVYTEVCGESDVMVAETYIKIAQFLEWRGRLEECIEIYQNLAEVQRRTLGDKDIALGTTYIRIAWLFRRQNNLEETRRLYVMILNIYHYHYAKADASVVARAYVYMVDLLLELGHVDEVIDLCERWLRTCEDRIFESDASTSSNSSSNNEYSNKLAHRTHTSLVNKLIKGGKKDEAMGVCQRFLDMYKAVFGEKPHPLVVHGRQCTAKVLREQGKEAEAVEMERLANGTTIALIVQKTYLINKGGEDAVASILKQTSQNASQKPALRSETKEFLSTLQGYLDCRSKMDAKYREIDEFQVIAKFELKTDSNGIIVPVASRKNRPLFKQKYQQQTVNGQPVRTLNDLYAAAEIALPVFQETIQKIVCLVRKRSDISEGDIIIKFAKLKGRDRSSNKAEDDYSNRDPGPGISWLFDIVRGSIEFTSAAQVRACLEVIQNDDSIHIVKAKNRFQEPTLSGYRDLNIQVRIDTQQGFFHICEVQLHHQAILFLDKQLKSHSYYEYFRKYFAGSIGSLQSRLEDLRRISEGGVIDNSFLIRLVETSDDEERLERLGSLFWHQLCEYNWALRVYRRMLDIQLEVSGATDSSAKTYLKIAMLLTEKGNLDEAWELCKACLQLRRHIDGEENAAFAEVYIQMALILTYRQGAFDDALKLCRHVLDIQNATFGPSSLPAADTLNHIADNLAKQGQLEEASSCLKDSIEIKANNLGEEHSLVAVGLQVMARLTMDRGKLEEALQLFDRSLEITKRTLGEEHSSIAKIYRGKARVLHDQGKLDEALLVYKRSLELLKKNYGETHYLVLDTYATLSDILHQQGRISEAEEYSNKKRDAKRKKLGLGGGQNILFSAIQSRKGGHTA
ncbi:unnamed protein product [Cylindrotheca closterium]|uniref:MalT-like TPR region domain-containing protein n=1 Tax=Cylindrotheca closterium TaxID=2856 RepID=A0AAD2JLU4_9STRA|nr:unnamed protein product [Cylindrotheca closterium]